MKLRTLLPAGMTLCAGLALWCTLGAQSAQKGKKAGEVNTPPAKGERVKDMVKVGDLAPDFTLADIKGDKKVTLSGFKDQKPVVLIFGSYT
jgi:hypothetical protein